MIDQGNRHPWPQAVVEQLARYRQGFLVERPPFAYYASGRQPVWEVSRLAAEDSPDEVMLVELDPADSPPYGIITTQSCDVDEEGRNRKPWVHLAPVYELPVDDPRLGTVRAWKFAYLAPVTSLGRTWVVDLRIEVPVEKGWLVQHPPRPAFVSPEEFDRFGRFLGDHRARQQLATSVYTLVLDPLKAALVALVKSDPGVHQAFVDEVKYLFLDVRGDRLDPGALQCVFVGEQHPGAEVQQRLDAWWEAAYSAGELPFTLLPNRYLAFEEVRFVESHAWLEQDLARLSSES